jgi:putative nucleotidyltransferase with HDIG domain
LVVVTEPVATVAREPAAEDIRGPHDLNRGRITQRVISPRLQLPRENRSAPSVVRFLPRVLAATALVAVFPAALVWWLQGEGVIGSTVLAAVLATLLSLVVSYCAERYWRARSSAEDLLFSELMIWGWIRRWWSQRQLASGEALFRGINQTVEIGQEEQVQALKRLASALELSDPYTHGHSRRVARYAAAIADRMGLPSDQVAKIRLAALLHDVGKISTPAGVLQKPGRLSEFEFDAIKQHPIDGANMVSVLGDFELTSMVRHHHERLDGNGYPDALWDFEIPLGARIIAVADTFDAITSTRPYRSANPHQQAMSILAAESGTQLDPEAVHAFEREYAGRRPFMIWVAITSFLPERLLSLLGGSANVAAASTARVMAVTAVTGAVAGAAAVQVVPLKATADSPSVSAPSATQTPAGSHPTATAVAREAHPVVRQRELAAKAKSAAPTRPHTPLAAHRAPAVKRSPSTTARVAHPSPARSPSPSAPASASTSVATAAQAASTRHSTATAARTSVATQPATQPQTSSLSTTPAVTVSPPTSATASTPSTTTVAAASSTPTPTPTPTPTTTTASPAPTPVAAPAAAATPTTTTARPTRRSHPHPTLPTAVAKATPGATPPVKLHPRPTSPAPTLPGTSSAVTAVATVQPIHWRPTGPSQATTTTGTVAPVKPIHWRPTGPTQSSATPTTTSATTTPTTTTSTASTTTAASPTQATATTTTPAAAGSSAVNAIKTWLQSHPKATPSAAAAATATATAAGPSAAAGPTGR